MGKVSLQREGVLAAYTDGVQAVEAAGGQVQDWSQATPCAQWRAVDLAGHLVAIGRYYHTLLDAAAAGRPLRGLPVGTSLQTMNERDLVGLPPGGGPERIVTFLRLARHYGQRVAEADWHSILGEWDRLGPLTIGQHTAVAAGEWHIHAWDLARSAGRDHRPADPATIAAGRRILSGLPAIGDPWRATLISSGRPAAPTERHEPPSASLGQPPSP